MMPDFSLLSNYILLLQFCRYSIYHSLLSLGSDFSDQCTTVTVPAAATLGTQTYTIQKFFTVVHDNINEVEPSFALAAEIIGVPSDCFVYGVGLTDCSCFQTRVGKTECFGDGRSGATEIRITDSDYKCMKLKVKRTGLYIP